MCQDIQQVLFTKCGHENRYYWGKSRFCLFYPHKQSGFHMTNTFNQIIDDWCPQCYAGEEIKKSGEKLSKVEFRERIAKKCPEEVKDQQSAKSFEKLAVESQKDVDAEAVAVLNKLVKSQIAFYVNKSLSHASKLALFDTILNVPDVLDRKSFVQFFGSRFFGNGGNKGMRVFDKTIFERARKVHFEKILKEAIALEAPLPIE